MEMLASVEKIDHCSPMNGLSNDTRKCGKKKKEVKNRCMDIIRYYQCFPLHSSYHHYSIVFCCFLFFSIHSPLMISRSKLAVGTTMRKITPGILLINNQLKDFQRSCCYFCRYLVPASFPLILTYFVDSKSNK